MIRLSGTTYRFHPLFILLMVLSILTGYFIELLTLFCIVFIHELGHVIAAKGFGWRVKEVHLLPFGGVAVVEEAGNVPAAQEFCVAMAGPLQNFIMIGFAYGMKLGGWMGNDWWDYFIQANLWIALFNLLPLLPLDGGKALLALLSYRFSYYHALHVGSVLSLFLSCIMMLISLAQMKGDGLQLNLLMISCYLLYANWYSYLHIPYHYRRFLISREGRSRQHIQRGTLAKPIIVGRNKKITEILQLFVREQYHLIFILSEEGRILQVMPEQQLIRYYFSEQHSGSAISELLL